MIEFNLAVLNAKNNFSNKTYGLRYLTPAYQDLLKKIPSVLNEIAETNAFRSNQVPTPSYQQSLAALRKPISTTAFVKQSKSLIQKAKVSAKVPKLPDWEEEQIAWLNNDDNWQRLCDIKPESKKEILTLRLRWLSQQQFTRTTNAFLMQTYEDLHWPQEHLTAALKELEKNKIFLPVVIADAYDIFLHDLQGQLTTLRNSLLNTMLSRLEVAGKKAFFTGNLHYDDVLIDTIEKLQCLGVLKKSLMPIGHWETLEPIYFNHFHQAIQNHGNLQLKKNLKQLPWFFSAKTNIEFLTIKIDEQSCLVPKKLIAFIPTKKYQPKWLYYTQNKNIDFIKQHQSIFASIALGLSTIQHVFPEKRFEILEKYESNLLSEKAKIDAKIPPRWQLWKFTYRQLLLSWQTILDENLLKCQQHRLKLLNNLSLEQPPTDYKETLQLWKLIKQQIKFAQTKTLTPDLKNSFAKIRAHLKIKLSHSSENFPLLLLKNLAAGKLLSENVLAYLYDTLIVNTLDPETNNLCKNIGLYQFQAAQTLLDQLDQLNFDCDQDFNNNLNAPIVKLQIALIKLLGHEKQQVQLDTFVLSKQTKKINVNNLDHHLSKPSACNDDLIPENNRLSFLI